MKTSTLIEIIFALAAILLVVSLKAEEAHQTNEVVFVTQHADGTTNTWTKADLVAALQLINRRYHRDCRTSTGRRAWHGSLKREIVDAEKGIKTEIYEDGKTFAKPFKVVTPAVAVAERNAKLFLSTNNVPKQIAAARMRRMAEKATTNVVNHVLKAGK